MAQIAVQEFADALRELANDQKKRIQNGFAMMKANYRAEGRTISASKLARAAGYEKYGKANEEYGRFAHAICDIVGFEPQEVRNGEPVWTYAICDASNRKDEHGHFQWVLRDEAATALEELGLVEPLHQHNLLQEIEDKRAELADETETRREAVIQARVGQGTFRDNLVRFWNGCSITGYDNTGFLIASHIKPWRDCDAIEALDVTNGLLLVPNIDRAFDQGYITFDSSGQIMLSPQLTDADLRQLGLNKDMKLRKCFPEHERFLQYHRENVFRGYS